MNNVFEWKTRKSAVLSQKNQRNQSFEVSRLQAPEDSKKIVFFCFFETVQHFSLKNLFFLGQYSTF